ncbi:hypothetical protein [Massilia agri]|uniref:Serine protease n=1 Tax=Massilia agri TaxID=1886785 RepID=A0ABT2ASV6_9BURK|nr:hypothetical protein [Massilia agri]MCS0599331.1 hypothetical protein [Massilia agri]
MDYEQARLAKKVLTFELNDNSTVLRKSRPFSMRRSSIALGIAVETNTYKVAIRVTSLDDLDNHERQIIRKFDDDEIDVRETGIITPAARSVYIGCSISHQDSGSGTLACVVQDRKTREKLLLSNDHVLGPTGGARLRAAVLHPSYEMGGRLADSVVGKLVKSAPLKRDGSINFVDAAVASIAPGVQLKDHGTPFEYRPDKPIIRVRQQTRVAKLGSRTGLTTGFVKCVDLDDIRVRYPTGSARFNDQIEVLTNFAQRGDSGSMVVEHETGAPIGLIFAVDEKGATYVTPLELVLDALKVDLI